MSTKIDVSVKELFGHECSGDVFRHDAEIREKQAQKLEKRRKTASQQTHTTTTSSPITPNQAASHFMNGGSSTSPFNSPRKVLVRNAQGYLRLQDANGEEGTGFLKQPVNTPPRVGAPDFSGSQRSLGSTHSLHASTPHQNTPVESPGSASQSARRKLIRDGAEDAPAKRQKVHSDRSSPEFLFERAIGLTTKNEAVTQSNSSKVVVKSNSLEFPGLEAILGPKQSGLHFSFSSSSHPSIGAREGTKTPAEPTTEAQLDVPQNSSQADTPGSEADSNREEKSGSRPLPGIPNQDEPRNSSMDDADLGTYFDTDDNITRCTACHYEVWTGSTGFCGRCHDEDVVMPPYYEVFGSETLFGPEERQMPGLEANWDAEESELEDMLAPYLDCGSSAYDSQDEESRFAEEYEINSFIDDSPEADADAEKSHSSDDEEEIDWEGAFRKLLGEHDSLSSAHGRLIDKYYGFKYKILGDQYDTSDDSEMEDSVDEMDSMDELDEMDEDGLLMVDVKVQDPAVTELVLSQAMEQTQEESLSPEQIRDRIEAFEAASNGEWHSVTMLSTGDNHTLREIEL